MENQENTDLKWHSFLKKQTIFSDLNENEIGILLKDNRFHKYSKGEDIINQGKEDDKKIFLIYSGSVQTVIQPEGNSKTINLITLGKGELFGEMALLEGEPRSVTVKANTDCTLFEIEGEIFREIINNNPGIKFQILSKLSQRVRKTNNKIINFQHFDVDSKIDNYILKFNAELNAIQATTEASLTVFDQVNSRATEVISVTESRAAEINSRFTEVVNSTESRANEVHSRATEVIKNIERNHQYTRNFIGVIGTVLTLFITLAGWFGFAKYQDLISTIDKYKQEIVEDKEKINSNRDSIEKDAKDVKDIKKQMKSEVEDIHKISKSVGQNISYQFKNSLESNKNNAKILYQALPEDDIPKALNEIERRIIIEDNKYFQDYTDLLLESLHYTNSPDNKIRIYYLLLSNAILINRIKFQDGSTFEKKLYDFEKYVQEHKNNEDILDSSYIEKAFMRRSSKDKHAFQRITKVIPAHFYSIHSSKSGDDSQ